MMKSGMDTVQKSLVKTKISKQRFQNMVYSQFTFAKTLHLLTRSGLEDIQPPLIDIKGSISAEEVTNVSELPRGSCTGTLIPDSGKEVFPMLSPFLYLA